MKLVILFFVIVVFWGRCRGHFVGAVGVCGEAEPYARAFCYNKVGFRLFRLRWAARRAARRFWGEFSEFSEFSERKESPVLSLREHRT